MSLGTGLQLRSKKDVSFESSSSFSFDGTDDFVDTGIQPDFIHTNATMSYWVNMDDLSGAQLSGTHNAKRFYLGLYNATAGMGVQNTNNLGSGADLSSFLKVDQWHHIAMVAEGGTATFYLDGVARDTLAYTQNSANNPSANLLIGAITNSGSTQDFMHAAISDFAIFSSALTAREVDAIYNNGRPESLLHHATLHAHYRMGEGTLTGGKRDGDENFLFDQSTNGGLGSELITNGTFDADSDWSHSGTTISGGTANFSVSSGGYIFMSQSESFVDGSTYQLTATVNGTASKEMRFMDNGANNGGLTTSNGVVAMTGSAQQVSITFTANANSSTILIGRHTSSGDYSFTVDNVSVKEIQNVGTISGATALPDEGAELVVNGTFSKNKDNWTAENSASLDSVDGKLQVTNPGGGNHGVATQQVTTVSGKTYRAKADLLLSSGTAVDLQFKLGTSSQGTQYYDSGDITSDSTQDVTFTATGTALHITLQNSGNNGTVGYFDNVSVREVTNGVPLQCKNLKPISRGQKAISFDGTDDVVDLGASSTFFSTNVNSISMWFKMPDTSGGAERIFVSNSDAGGSDLRVVVSTGGTISVDFWNGSSLSSTTGGSAIDDDIWHNLVFTTTASAQALYIDGVSVATTTHTRASRAGSVSATIGAHVASGVYADVDVSDVAIYNVVLPPTAAKAIYNAGQSTHLSINTGAYDAYAGNLLAYYKMGSATVPGADNTNGFLFDQTSPGVGTELVKTDPFVTGTWSGYSANVVTFPSTTTVRVERPTSGGSSMGAAADLNTTILQSTPAAGTTLKISFDLNTDDSNLYADIYNGSASTSTTAGSGSKTVFVTMTGAGFIRFAGLDSDKFVELSNLTIREVNGHTGTITSATVVDNNVPRQIYALPPVDNKFSLTLDGSNDHILTNVDATAQANSTSRYYSFWFKSSSSTSHQPIFDHGDSNIGALHFNLSGNRAYIYMSNNSYRDFADFAAQDDQAWHHVLCRIAFNDIANCELFVDGVKIAPNSTENSGSMNEYTTGLRIGRGGSNYGNFSIDEVSIYGDLSNPSEVARALYNAGRPIDPSKSLGAANQPQLLRHYYRMGDASLDGTADGTNNVLFQGVQYLGDELIENGTYDSDTSGWIASDGATLTVVEGKLRITSSSSYKYAYQSFPTEVGVKYLFSVTGTKGTSPNYDAYFGTGINGATVLNPGAKGAADSQGDSVIITDTFTATATTTFITLRSRNEGSIANAFTDFDDVSVKQVRGQYSGVELMKADDDLYIDARWYVFSDPAKTYPGGTAARFTNPATGGWNQGGRIFLTTGSGTHALTENMETGCVYKLSFDFSTDDSDAVPSYHDGTSATSLPAGSGSKTFYFSFSGNASTRLEAANVSASKFVEFSKLSLTKLNGGAAMVNMDPGSDIQTDTPY